MQLLSRAKYLMMNPVLGICSKFGYISRTRTASQAISRIVFFILLFVFAVIIIFTIYIVLSESEIRLKGDSILINLVSYFLPVGISLVSFDIIKEIVAAEIQALEEDLKGDPETVNNVMSHNAKLISCNQKLKSRNQELEKSTDAEVLQNQQRYYMARTYLADKEVINRQMRLEKITSSGYRKYYNSLAEAREYFEKVYGSREERAKLRAVIVKLSKESWIKLATEATKAGLRPEKINAEILKNDPIKYLLFSDIYLYLSAWLVSSVDNDVTSVMPYMPIEDIGLHYPSEQEPDVEVYKKAFRYLKIGFKEGLFVRLIKECQIISEQDEAACQIISKYMDELVLRLEELPHSQPEG